MHGHIPILWTNLWLINLQNLYYFSSFVYNTFRDDTESNARVVRLQHTGVYRIYNPKVLGCEGSQAKQGYYNKGL